MLPALFAVICMLGLCGNGLVIFCTIFLTKYRTCTGNVSRTFASIKSSMIIQKYFRWQWCWWHRYVGDFMVVTDFRCWAESLCWRHFSLCWWFSQYNKSVNIILSRLPTSQTCHQHIWSPTSVTNIDVTQQMVHLI